MVEAYVRLLCPRCNKDWESTPRELPAHDQTFQCSGCGASRRLAEFTRTDYDLKTLKDLQ